MKIERVEAWAVRMRLEEPYTIAYETVEETTNVYLRLVAGRFTGIGCAAPDEAVTGETAGSVETALAELAEPVLAGADPLRWGAVLETLRRPLGGQPAARAAVT